MKKSVIILLCFALCGCGVKSSETEGTTALPVETASTTAVTTTAPPVTTTIGTTTERMDEFWLSEYKWCIDRQRKLREICKTVEISEDAVFYECKYTKDGVCTPQEYPYNDVLVDALEYFYTTDAYKEIYDKAVENYIAQDGVIKGEFLVPAKVVEAITYDFNTDGKEETAVLFQIIPDTGSKDEIAFMSICMALDYNAPRYLVFIDSSGKFSISDTNYAMNAELFRLRYNGFSHLVISGGVSNNSSCADFYNVEETGFVHKLREFRAYGIMDGVFLNQTMAQASWSWLIFWSEEHNSYLTPAATILNPEESLEIQKKFPESSGHPVMIIGGSIYSEMASNVYRLIDDEFVEIETAETYLNAYGERQMGINREFAIPYVTNFDYERALQNVVALE